MCITKSNNAKHSSNITPFLKWPGGKQWLIKRHRELFPSHYRHYYEPFLGGGAVFFGIDPEAAVISDLNPDLINLYSVMKNDHEKLMDLMITHQSNHNHEYYYKMRGEVFSNHVERAAQLLYLNRTCYNGMYRVNKAGQFNVPKGLKENCIYDITLFPKYSSALSVARIFAQDFQSTICLAKEGDFIFVDPPYTTSVGQQSFLKYNDKVFSWDDQIRLFQCLDLARERGVQILMTNANCNDIIELYSQDNYRQITVDRASLISGKVSKRRTIQELIITANI